ncbi:hypothetical protein [Marinobacter caseinilyticus]|uniref:hypothetical protein n=1 Tax=Marinobacter caseinilyticus TaxID=2692195 RepID=UPI00140E23D9|nr:hypothetical protein [Marinobacter caseinilyticus]
MQKSHVLACALLLALPVAALADEVINDDLIVPFSTCVGADCVDGEAFGFDTLRLKSPSPQILFDDTSNSGSFPNQDWSIGITDGGLAVPTWFFIKNVTNNLDALVISADGDVALGAGSELVEGAVSVGNLGSERRVTFVADAVDDSDAVNLGQFQTFQATALATVSTEVSDLDSRLAGLESRLTDLVERLDAVAAKVN